MNRIAQLCVMASAALFALCVPASAADALIEFSPSFGAAIIILGAGFGIAKIGAAAVESMARQPEASGDIRGGMILAAALIEGATFFALIVCILHNNAG